MNEFVQNCRAEWKRLGVPDRDADEMASDLAADIDAAGADGVSAEDLLGPSAADPRAFAASWAAARGVIPVPDPPLSRRRRGPVPLIAFTAVSVVAFVASVVMLATGQPKIVLHTSVSGAPQHMPGGANPLVPGTTVLASGAAPVEWLLLVFSVVALAFCAWLWFRRTPGSGARVPRPAARA